MPRSISALLLGLAALGSALVLSGCEPESGPGTIHPVEARIPQFDAPDHTITMESTPHGDAPDGLSGVLNSPAWSVGAREGPAPKRFGDIRDIAQDGKGRVLVLDNEHAEVRIFSTAGNYVGAFGRKGEGPGEFQYPAHLAFLHEDTLMVAGRMGRIQFFAGSGQTYERTGGFTVEFTPEDACILEGRLYLHGALAKKPKKSIHAYTPSGKHVTSFGPMYEANDEFIRYRMSSGAVACDSDARSVAFAFTSTPMVYGFDPSGTQTWVSRIRPFAPMPHEQGISEQGTTSLKHRTEPDTDLLTELTDVPGPGIVAQRMRFPPEEQNRAKASIYTYWLSSADGTGTYVGEGTIGGPAAGPIHHVSSTHLFSTRSTPFPKVDVYDVQDLVWPK